MILCFCIGMAPGLSSGLSTPYYKIYEKKRKKSVPEEKQNSLNSFDVCVSATTAVNFATQSDGTVASMETYTVFYDANGGSGAPPAQTKTQGVPLILSDVQPTRTGYTFLGWSRNSNALHADYGPGDRYMIDLSATLYAVWQKNPEIYTVSYHANGGSGAPKTQTKTEGSTLYLSDVVPTKGRIFRE